MGAALAGASKLRGAGLSAELVATGSPRKRYDRAVKKGPLAIIVLTVRDEKLSVRINAEESINARLGEVISTFKWPELASR